MAALSSLAPLPVFPRLRCAKCCCDRYAGHGGRAVKVRAAKCVRTRIYTSSNQTDLCPDAVGVARAGEPHNIRVRRAGPT